MEGEGRGKGAIRGRKKYFLRAHLLWGEGTGKVSYLFIIFVFIMMIVSSFYCVQREDRESSHDRLACCC